MSSPDYTLWSIWKYLPNLQRTFCAILFLVGAYTLISSAIMVMRALSIPKKEQLENSAFALHFLAALQARSANLQQLLGGTFYLFGFIFFVSLPFAFTTLGDSRTPGWVLIFQDLAVYFAFAANIFFVFLVLHLVQWFAASRIHAATLRLKAQTLHR